MTNEEQRLQFELNNWKIRALNAEKLRDEWCQAYTQVRDELNRLRKDDSGESWKNNLS